MGDGCSRRKTSDSPYNSKSGERVFCSPFFVPPSSRLSLPEIFASLIPPAALRLRAPPIHVAMGGHRSRKGQPTAPAASCSLWSICACGFLFAVSSFEPAVNIHHPSSFLRLPCVMLAIALRHAGPRSGIPLQWLRKIISAFFDLAVVFCCA